MTAKGRGGGQQDEDMPVSGANPKIKWKGGQISRAYWGGSVKGSGLFKITKG